MDNSHKNYYEILEISTSAGQDEIFQSYQRAKSAYSQDSLALYSLMSADECQKMLNLVDEAFFILSDPEKRKLYDNARGIKPLEASEKTQMERTSLHKKLEQQVSMPAKSEVSQKSMPKIVAQQRFNLDYKVDENFEREIEQATEFSGEFLRRIREYKQVDIPRLADLTKVSKTYIRNIEDENVDGLPALVYTRGFVYQYAKCLRLNPDMVATSYIHRLKKLNP